MEIWGMRKCFDRRKGVCLPISKISMVSNVLVLVLVLEIRRTRTCTSTEVMGGGGFFLIPSSPFVTLFFVSRSFAFALGLLLTYTRQGPILIPVEYFGALLLDGVLAVRYGSDLGRLSPSTAAEPKSYGKCR